MAKVTPGKVEETYERFIAAWENLTPTKVFGGLTLDQFKATVKPSSDARKSVKDAQIVLEGAIEGRDNADQATLSAMDAVKKSVIADPTVGGDDGALRRRPTSRPPYWLIHSLHRSSRAGRLRS